MKTALIFGISGQDGSYLSELLLSKGYRVVGMIRRHSVPENQNSRVYNIPVETRYGDLLDCQSIRKLIREVQPDEIYNLAAQSHVRISFDVPEYTSLVNGAAVGNILRIILDECPKVKFYQASSSEMFGGAVDRDGMQRETTLMRPTSPYGCSKHFAYDQVQHYRRAYKLFAVNGILFNHTSPRRGSNFVEAKIVKTACRIKLGLEKKLVLGNLDALRDWGHSEDYVRAMWMMMQQDQPDDFVVASGEARSVRHICHHVFKMLGMNWIECVEQDPKYMRPEELPYLCGDAGKARTVLGWSPEWTFDRTLESMVDHWRHRCQTS